MRRVIVGLVILAVVIGVPQLITRLIFSQPFFAPVLHGHLTNVQEKEADAYIANSNQLTTLSTLIFGGIAFYFNVARDVNKRRIGIPLIATSAILAGVSIFCGYSSNQAVVWMLSKDFFDLDNPRVLGFQVVQVWTFLSSIGFFSWAVATAL